MQLHHRRTHILSHFVAWCLALAIVSPVTGEEAPARPNILWLSCEDISPHLGCYGDPHAITPNLDQLASRGTRFTNVFTAAGVCAPCRSTIITGMYQNSIGTHHMRCNAVLPKWLTPFPALMRDAGYYCTNNSKTDYQFKKPSSESIWDESNSKAHWKNRNPDQPFFAVFNFTGCHESGIADEKKYRKVTSELDPSQRQDAEKLTTLPPYYPDTPTVREDWKRNYELITAMDAWAGEHLDALDKAGLSDNTIVVFFSDHGVGLPRAKRWLYDSGTRIPFVVYVPKRLQETAGIAQGINDELVNSVDFGPTALSLAGVKIPEYTHGRAFMGPARSPAPQYVYGARDRMDERYDIIRAVRGKRFRYIRNYEPLKPYYQYMNTPEKGATMKEIRRAEQANTLPGAAKQFSLGYKPVEELYDLKSDPHEINNLAGLPEHADRLATMRDACLAWQADIGDLGLVPEAEIEARTKIAGSCYAILNTPGQATDLRPLVDIAAAASDGPKALSQLTEALSSTDATIRYWAATGIGNIAAAKHTDVIKQLSALLTDDVTSVRVAAARGMCRCGDLDAGLPVLEQELSSELEWARLAAAIALDELDETARPVLPALQAALVDQPNKYIVRVANKAVNDLLGTHNTVP
ncbi:MAG: sulfatase-like hydrolase/transferase [Aureliella sp.]